LVEELLARADPIGTASALIAGANWSHVIGVVRDDAMTGLDKDVTDEITFLS